VCQLPSVRESMKFGTLSPARVTQSQRVAEEIFISYESNLTREADATRPELEGIEELRVSLINIPGRELEENERNGYLKGFRNLVIFLLQTLSPCGL
jgi:hypothetical protein